MKVVICGGGIIGTCVAYFLAEHGVSSTVVERHQVACAASGRAGGFLARDWCRGDGGLGEFAPISFDLHHELSQKLDGEANYDYRRLEAFSLKLKRGAGPGTTDPRHAWLDGCGVDRRSLSMIGSSENIAQLHPRKFVRTLTKCNQERGVEVLEEEEVCGIIFDDDNTKVRGVSLLSGRELECDAVVIAMGPWSGLAGEWFPHFPSFYGHKAHSITVDPSAPVPAEAIFTEFGGYSPELYPRPDGEVYVCGMAENPLPSRSLPPSDKVACTAGSCEKVKDMSDLVSRRVEFGRVTRGQACFLPITQDGAPVIGAVPGAEGAFVAAGHGCWGILNAPATGKSLADLIATGTSRIDISAFDPRRFMD